MKTVTGQSVIAGSLHAYICNTEVVTDDIHVHNVNSEQTNACYLSTVTRSHRVRLIAVNAISENTVLRSQLTELSNTLY